MEFEIGESGPHDAAQSARSAQAALDVEKVGFDALGAGFVEARFDHACRVRERLEVAPLEPGAARRARDRGDHRDRRVFSHLIANFAHERRDHGATPIQESPEIAVAAGVGRPERLGHVGGKVDVALKVSFDIRGDLASHRLDLNSSALGARHAVRAEAKAKLAVEPAICRG